MVPPQKRDKDIDFGSEHGFDGVLVEGWNKGWDQNYVAMERVRISGLSSTS